MEKIQTLSDVSGTLASGQVFKTLVQEKAFRKIFIRSQFEAIQWTDLGERIKNILKELKVGDNCLFEGNDLKVIEGKLDTLDSSVFNYVYLGDARALQQFKTDFAKFTSNTLLNRAIKNFELNPQLKRLIYFINDISNSVDAEQVQAALESFALPVGSYSIKRKSNFNVSLGTSPGVLYTFSEKTDQDKSNMMMPDTISTNGIGFTAPVGLSISTGWKLGGWSLGIFAPIIDVGALTHYRFNTANDSEALPKVNLRNILAFGAHFQVGIGNTPLTFSCGWQTGPQVRVVDQTIEGGFRSIDSQRWSIGLTVDIPIMNLYTKSK